MVETLEGVGDIDSVLKGDRGLFRNKPLEESLARRFITRLERPGLQAPFRIRGFLTGLHGA